MLALIKQVVDDNIIYLSATQLSAHIHAPAHGARNTVQQLLHKTQRSFVYSFLFVHFMLL